MRNSGQTFRAVLRTVAHASSTENARAIYVGDTRDHLMRAFRMCCDILNVCIPDFFLVNMPEMIVTLRNGSVIKFCSTEYIEKGAWHGLNLTYYEQDVYERQSSQYHASWKELQIYAGRHK